MPLDPVIAGGFRGLQLQDPLEQYGRISQIQQAQQQNALNALKMQEYQREAETENRLRALYARPDANLRSPEFLREVYAVSPAKGAAMQKSAFEAEKEKRLSDAAMEDLAAKRIANARAVLPSVTPDTWAAWRADTIQKLPGLAGTIPEAYSDDAKMQLMQTADQFIASRKPVGYAPGTAVYEPGKTTPKFTVPAAPVKPTPAETEELVMRLEDQTLTPAARKRLEARLDILTKREPKEAKADETKVIAQTVYDAAGTPTFLNKFGQVITPTTAAGAPATVKGKPSATFEKTTAQRKQLSVDLDRAIGELTEAAKDGGLIDRSTGSGIGRGRDIAMGLYGGSSSGAIASSELAPIADMVLKMVPRFEGPQSNKDTTSYEQAAGQLGNPTIPSDRRKAAAKVLVRLMTERKGQFITREMATEGSAAAPATGGRPSLDDIFKQR